MRWTAANGWTAAALEGYAQTALGFTYQTDTYIDAAGTPISTASPAASMTAASRVQRRVLPGRVQPERRWRHGRLAAAVRTIPERLTPNVTTGAAFRCCPAATAASMCCGSTRTRSIARRHPRQCGHGGCELHHEAGQPVVVRLRPHRADRQSIVPLPGDAGADNLLLMTARGRCT